VCGGSDRGNGEKKGNDGKEVAGAMHRAAGICERARAGASDLFRVHVGHRLAAVGRCREETRGRDGRGGEENGVDEPVLSAA
jgi:hypothetical protein